MKNACFSCLFAVAASCSLNAQTRFAPFIGAAYNVITSEQLNTYWGGTLRGQNTVTNKFEPSVGFIIEVRTDNHWYMQTGLYYGRTRFLAENVQYVFRSLDLPAIFMFKTGRPGGIPVVIGLGPGIRFNIDGTSQNMSGFYSPLLEALSFGGPDASLKQWNFNANVLLGCELKRWQIRFEYCYFFDNLMNNNNTYDQGKAVEFSGKFSICYFLGPSKTSGKERESSKR